jgi:hypothetical protein
MGLNFGLSVIDNSGQFFEDYNFWATFISCLIFYIDLTKTVWAIYILSDFFTNTSGHPAGHNESWSPAGDFRGRGGCFGSPLGTRKKMK